MRTFSRLLLATLFISISLYGQKRFYIYKNGNIIYSNNTSDVDSITFIEPAPVNIPITSMILSYWYDNNSYIKHNIRIPAVGEINSALAVFENDLSSAFLQNPDKSLLGLNNYEYYFYPEQPENFYNTNIKFILTTNSEGNKLLYHDEIIASINSFISGVGDILTLNKNSEKAQILLNYANENLQARIGIRRKLSSTVNFYPDITINGKPYFDIKFIRPIKILPNTSYIFIDQAKGGETGSSIPVDQLVCLADWRHNANYESTFAKYSWLSQYYGHRYPFFKVNIDKILDDLDGEKKTISEHTTLSIKIDFLTSNNGTLTFQNTGKPIDKDFNLFVPVYVYYNWGILNDTIVIPVRKSPLSTGDNFSETSGTFTDARDGAVYKWIKIGSQIWMTENLKATKYNDGTEIPNVTNQSTWNGLSSGAYCYYNNEEAQYRNTYGGLYNWYAVNTGKLAPKGWHVPTDAEWTTLSDYLGGESVAGGKMKSTIGWNSPNTGATNSSGFSALPGGGRYDDNFHRLGECSIWWSSTPYDTFRILAIYTVNNNNSLNNTPYGMFYGFSVRCVRD